MSIPLANALAVATNALGAGALSAETLPSGARIGFEMRLRELDQILEFPRPDRVRSIVTGLGTMPSRAEDDPAVQRFVVEQYVAICSDVPEWALDWAAWQFLRHEAGSGFRPTGGELRAHAMSRVRDLEIERQRVNAVLTAKLAPPAKPLDVEDRKRLGDMLRSSVADLQVREAAAEKARGVKTSPQDTPEAKLLRRDARGVVDPAERDAIAKAQLAHLESRKGYLASPLTVSELLEGKVKGRSEGETS